MLTIDMKAKFTTKELKEGSYLCRMDNCYIKMCYFNGVEWLDMWKRTLEGKVVKWINIPKEL
tara:strand:+ start:598 stop:783 length:186 start_codon:yes stop_codon:yes gene_type:complete